MNVIASGISHVAPLLTGLKQLEVIDMKEHKKQLFPSIIFLHKMMKNHMNFVCKQFSHRDGNLLTTDLNSRISRRLKVFSVFWKHFCVQETVVYPNHRNWISRSMASSETWREVESQPKFTESRLCWCSVLWFPTVNKHPFFAPPC